MTLYYVPNTTGWVAPVDNHPIVLLTTTTPTLNVTPGHRTLTARAGTTNFTVSNFGGWIMPYTASESEPWFKITSGSFGINAGTITVVYDANSGTTARTGTVIVAASGANGTPQTVTITQMAPVTMQDFNGDGVSDQAVFDTQGGYWYIKAVAGRVLTWANQWGWSTAQPVPGDFNGDGKWDQAVFDKVGGYWYIKSLDGQVILWKNQWGWNTAKPVPGDYNGDGKSDLAVFDTVGGYWYIKTLNNQVLAWAQQWGWSSAVPVPGDYDGDGKSDLAVYDTATGCWYIRRMDGSVILWAKPWGWRTAVPVPGDYDGDGKSDLAVYDTVNGYWYIESITGIEITSQYSWGWRGGKPIPGDYDGDGRCDLAVYNAANGSWYIKSLNGGVIAWGANWGWPGALPVPDSLGTFYPNFLFFVNNASGFTFSTSTLTDLNKGTVLSLNSSAIAGLFPGTYKLDAKWSGRSGSWVASGTASKTFTATPGRDYQAILSGGSWNAPWYTPPSMSIKAVGE